MRFVVYSLVAACGGLVIPPRYAGQDRRLAPAASTLDAEGEFATRLAFVEALRGVLVQEGDVVSLGLVGGVSVSREMVVVDLDLPRSYDEASAGELAAQCERAATATRDALATEGLLSASCGVEVAASVGRREAEASAVEGSSSTAPAPPEAVRRVKRIVAVSSCKGGVGKSTVATNLAFGLAARGLAVGIVDADVHGPSLPLLVGEPDVPAPGESYVRLAPEMDEFGRELLEPLEKAGVKLMSFGYLSGDAPAMMRGSRVAGVVQQLATAVAWRDLDYLVVDMPPGTGDAQLTLCQQLALDAAVVVTTPSRLAFADVVKGVKLFDEVSVPVVAVVENMAGFQPQTRAAEHTARRFVNERRGSLGLDDPQAESLAHDLTALLSKRHDVFGAAHSRKLREMWGIDHAFEIPLARDVAARSDSGVPLHLASDLSPEEMGAKRVVDDLVDAVLVETGRRAALEPPVLAFDGRRIHATFRGTTFAIDPADLRRRCRCAACINEATGELNPLRAPVANDVRPVTITPTGNYAAAVAWSDGHQSLYPYKAFVPAYRQTLEEAATNNKPV